MLPFCFAERCWHTPTFLYPAVITRRSLPRSAVRLAFFLVACSQDEKPGTRVEYDSQREFSAFPDENETTEIVATAKDYLGQGKSLRDRILRVARIRSEQASALPLFVLDQLNSGLGKRGNE